MSVNLYVSPPHFAAALWPRGERIPLRDMVRRLIFKILHTNCRGSSTC